MIAPAQGGERRAVCGSRSIGFRGGCQARCPIGASVTLSSETGSVYLVAKTDEGWRFTAIVFAIVFTARELVHVTTIRS
jgi:hypothetical protein